MSRLAALSLVFGAAWALALSAQAQTNIQPPPGLQSVDQFGVELSAGSLSVSSPTISIGDPANGGLSYSATWDTGAKAWRSSTWGGINKATIKGDPNCFAWITVTALGETGTFQQDTCSGAYYRLDGLGTLTRSGDIWTYTGPDGSIATYDYALRTNLGAKFSANQGVITSITRPNGEILKFTWLGASQPRSVTNNYGYQLFFAYTNGDLTSVTALNNAVDGCAPAANACTFSRTWPSLTFSTVGSERRVTDALGRTTRLIFDNDPAPNLIGVARPSKSAGSSTSYVWTRIFPYGMRVTSASDGVGTWNYDYEQRPCEYEPGNIDPTNCLEPNYSYEVKTTITAPDSGQTTYTFAWDHPNFSADDVTHGLTLVKDANLKTWEVLQSAGGLSAWGAPEGNKVTFDRDNETSALIQTNRLPKPGLGQPVLSEIKAYPSCATTTPILCRRPTTSTDARGSVTEFEYDAAGNLTKEKPPLPGPTSTRPETRYVWTQKRAWFKQNGDTAITESQEPIWVLTQTSQCMAQATNSCVGGADEMRSTIDYQVGSASVGSNLLPITKGQGAGNGTKWTQTQYTYTENGDVKTVDGPVPGAVDTTRTYYDAMREVVGVIGPDPEGTGAYRATMIVYNLDGQVTHAEIGIATNQGDTGMASFSPRSVTRNTYDAQTGRLIKTEEVRP